MVASTFSRNSLRESSRGPVESTHSYHSGFHIKNEREEISDDRFVEGSFLNEEESSVQSKSITTTTNAESPPCLCHHYYYIYIYIYHQKDGSNVAIDS